MPLLYLPLTEAMWDAVDALCCGMTNEEWHSWHGAGSRAIQSRIREAALRIPGHKNHSARERVLFWRAKQIGVAEYLAGLRDGEGFPIVPRDIPAEYPMSHQHDSLFPE